MYIIFIQMSKLNKLRGTRNGTISFPEFILKRHLACFGSSGSGKTVASKVIIEELATMDTRHCFGFAG